MDGEFKSAPVMLYVLDFRRVMGFRTPDFDSGHVVIEPDEVSGTVTITGYAGDFGEALRLAGSVQDEMVAGGIAQIAPPDYGDLDYQEDVVEL